MLSFCAVLGRSQPQRPIRKADIRCRSRLSLRAMVAGAATFLMLRAMIDRDNTYIIAKIFYSALKSAVER